VSRAAAFGVKDGTCVLARRIQVHVNLLESIPWAERPAIRDPPVCRYLESARFSMHKVLVGKRQNKMWRSWRGLEEWSRRFGGLLVIVAAVIRGHVNREIVKKRSPVTCLVRRHSFIVNVRIAHQRDQRRSAPGPRKTGEV
jgi:hypothetical protein